MTWSERQRRMLAAMSLRVWTPPPAAARGAQAAGGEAVRSSAEADEVAIAVAARPDEPGGDARRASSVAAPERAPRVQDGVAPAETAARIPVAAATAERAARVESIAAMDLPALRQAVADCTACGLCAARRQTVFGVGHSRAQWMIVGEAPGEQEDLKGEPFVGAAGQLLDQMLRALGLSRTPELPPVFAASGTGAATAPPIDDEGDPSRRVFIANTLKCRPPRNRNPEPDELAACEPFLRRQVELVLPRLILLMGRFAVKTLLKSDEAIGRLRGRLHRYEGIPVVVTYHPAYLLRNLPDKGKAWADLCFAARTMDELRAAPGVTSPSSPDASTPDS